MNPDPSRQPAARPGGRSLGRRWLLAALALALVLAGSGLLWYVHWRKPPPRPPEVEGAGTDPEVAAFLREARAAVLRQPNSAEAWGFLARGFHAHNFFPQALACYAEAERLDPANADWPYLRAEILAAGPEPAAALPALRRAVECAPVEPLPRLRLGEELLEQGDADGASGQFRAVLAADAAEPRARLRLAQLAAWRQEWSECLRHLDAARATPPARKQACALRARADEALGDAAAAREQRRLLAAAPEDPPWPDAIVERSLSLSVGLPARINLATQLLDDHRAPEAVRLLEDTVRDYPDSAVAWDTLGRSLGGLGRFAEAERALLRSTELAPDSGEVWFFLGRARLEQGKFDGALTAFRTAARLKPTDTRTHCKIGECLAATGDRPGAAAAYREALRYQPDLAEAQAALARLREEPRP
jgi:cytochrome c-type biogenesis protein CcmH/NrfG